MWKIIFIKKNKFSLKLIEKKFRKHLDKGRWKEVKWFNDFEFVSWLETNEPSLLCYLFMYDDYGPTLWHSTLVIIQGCLFINLLNLEGLVLLEEKKGLFGLFVIFKYRAVVERRLKEKLESLSVVFSDYRLQLHAWRLNLGAQFFENLRRQLCNKPMKLLKQSFQSRPKDNGL